MNPTEMIAMTTGLLEAGVHLTDLVQKTVKVFEDNRGDAKRLETIQTRMLFNETMQNIEVLDRIKLKKGVDVPVTHPHYLPVALQLSTQVHEAVLVHGDLHPEPGTWLSRLSGRETVQLLDETVDNALGERATALTVHQALLYTTNKIRALQTICSGELNGSEVIEQVRYGVRLRNILRHEALIADTLYNTSAMEKLRHISLSKKLERTVTTLT